MKNWEVGRLGGWEIGRLGGWEVGRLGGWEIGKLGKESLMVLSNLPAFGTLPLGIAGQVRQPPSLPIAALKVRWGEATIGRQVRAAGGRRAAARQGWWLSCAQVKMPGLTERLVEEEDI